MIAIRADGNSEIATGHIMRCLAIASALKEKGHDCIFITADEDSEKLLSNSGFKIVNLHSIWNRLDSEISKITDAVTEYNIDKLIVDTYYVTEEYLRAAEDKCRVYYIDDLNLFRYPVSAVINYNVYARSIPYSEVYADTDTKLFLGPAYAPLRSEFKDIIPSFRREVKRILITAGGVDTYNAAGLILNRVLADDFFEGIEFHVAAGRLNHHISELEDIAERYPSAVIHKNAEKMSELMTGCDAAVTAGGTTLYELCACGVPSVCFSWADNQLAAVKAFSESGLMIGAGDIRGDCEGCVLRIADGLKRYCGDYYLRCSDGRKLKEVADGCGADRICEMILSG
ncbi:MAG TPA: UDP-2,4-diacetamido-2,4,6-trideoxy-beta-L-altropyranose hydrolase [Methanocorpusculum sp.]|nr:UDP-2,4-diacetamido-2,4,6-trideoxy-beta-L-altropyranose hydrolase [Methanocorpusculum sp.]